MLFTTVLAIKGLIAFLRDFLAFLKKRLSGKPSGAGALKRSASDGTLSSSPASRASKTSHRKSEVKVYIAKTSDKFHYTLKCQGLQFAEKDKIVEYSICKHCAKLSVAPS